MLGGKILSNGKGHFDPVKVDPLTKVVPVAKLFGQTFIRL